MLDWLRFARKGKDVAPNADPESAATYNDRAFDQMVELLTRIPENDEILNNAGITRCSLKKLKTDDEIYQALRTRKDAVLATNWRMEPGNGNVTEFIMEELTPIIEDVVGGAWEAIPFGYSVLEVIYKRRADGRVGIDRVVQKPMEWFDPRPDGTLRYFAPNGGDAGIEVDQTFKFLLTRNEPSYQNPKGEALLSRLYWPWFFRFNGWRFWGQFLERFGTPILVGKSTSPAKMAQALLNAHQDAVIAHGTDDDVKALAPGGDGATFAAMEQAVVRRIQKLLLGQTLTSDGGGKGSGGSYALGVVHNSVRDDLRRSDLRLVRKTVQKIVDALCAINFPTRVIPKFKFSDERGLEVERAQRDKILSETGVIFMKQYFIDRYDLLEGDFEVNEDGGNHNDLKPSNSNGNGSALRDPRKVQDTGATEDKKANEPEDD